MLNIMRSLIKQNKKILIIFFSALICGSLFFILQFFHNEGVELVKGDEPEYFALSKNIGHVVFGQTLRTPVYPAFIAIISNFFGSVSFVFIAQSFLFAFSCVLIYFLLKKFFSEKTAFAASFLFAIWPYNSFIANSLWAEVLFLFLFLLSMIFFVRGISSLKVFDFCLAGLFLGLATLTKPVSQFFIAIFLVGIAYCYWKKQIKLNKTAVSAFAAIAVFFLMISPISIRNYIKFGTFELSSISGYNLYLYNAGYVWALHKNYNYMLEGSHDLALKAQEKYGLKSEDLTDIRYSSILKKESLEIFKQYPMETLRMALPVSFFLSTGVREMFNYFEPQSQNYVSFSLLLQQGKIVEIFKNINIIDGAGWFVLADSSLRIILVLFYLLASLCFANIARGKESPDKFIFWLLFLTIIYFTALGGPAVGNARYRFPIDWIIFAFAFQFLFSWLDNRKITTT